MEGTVATLVELELEPAAAGRACRTVVLFAIGCAAVEIYDSEGFWAELAIRAGAGGAPVISATSGDWAAPPEQHVREGLTLLCDGLAASIP